MEQPGVQSGPNSPQEKEGPRMRRSLSLPRIRVPGDQKSLSTRESEDGSEALLLEHVESSLSTLSSSFLDVQTSQSLSDMTPNSSRATTPDDGSPDEEFDDEEDEDDEEEEEDEEDEDEEETYHPLHTEASSLAGPERRNLPPVDKSLSTRRKTFSPPTILRAKTLPAIKVLSSPTIEHVEYASSRSSRSFRVDSGPTPFLIAFVEENETDIHKEFLETFRESPKKGVGLLFEIGFCRKGTASDVAYVFMNCKNLSKSRIGRYLGEPHAFNQEVLVSLLAMLDFTGMDFDAALRHLLSLFVLPGEAQQIDRIIEAFACRYHEQNPASFRTKDAAYLLAFAIIMLNTDAHNPKIKKRMTKEQFVKNLRGVDDQHDIDPDFLEKVYDNVVENEIRMKDVKDLMDEEEFRDIFLKGTVFLKHGRRGRPHKRLVCISEDGRSVSWQPVDKIAKKKMLLANVVGVHLGASTRVFRRTVDIHDKDKVCISLIGKKRTLDLEAPSEQVRDIWYEHFVLIVQRNQLEDRTKVRRQLLAARDRAIEQRGRIWKEKVLPNWDILADGMRVRQLVLRGVPPHVRSLVWSKLIGNRLGITKEMYDDLMAQAESTRELMHSLAPDERLTGFGDSMDVMKRGIEETFPAKLTHEGRPLSDSILDVLDAWMMYHPEIGFVEGLAHVSAMFLIYAVPCDSFIMLANVVEKLGVEIFMTKNQSQIRTRVEFFERRLAKEHGSVYSRLVKWNISSDVFLVDWFCSLFTKCLSLDVCSRIWDWCFLDGEVALFRTALGIIHCLSNRLEKSAKEEALTILKGHFFDVQADTLFSAIEKVKLTKEKLEKNIY